MAARSRLGHPLGCTGAKLTASILRELERRNGRYGMVTMCVGGGMGAAGIFERLESSDELSVRILSRLSIARLCSFTVARRLNYHT